MGETEYLEKEKKELYELEDKIKSLKVIKNLKLIVKDYIDKEKEKEKAISND